MSVRAYMQTPKFVIRDGWVSLANTSSIQLRDLDDVIDGRDHGGAPYWTFAVEDRFFDGYSVTGVPPEFAKALGCAPDAGERVRIDNLPGCARSVDQVASRLDDRCIAGVSRRAARSSGPRSRASAHG